MLVEVLVAAHVVQHQATAVIVADAHMVQPMYQVDALATLLVAMWAMSVVAQALVVDLHLLRAVQVHSTVVQHTELNNHPALHTTATLPHVATTVLQPLIGVAVAGVAVVIPEADSLVEAIPVEAILAVADSLAVADVADNQANTYVINTFPALRGEQI